MGKLMFVSFDIQFTRLGVENACCIDRPASQCQQAFSKPCQVNLISKETHLVFFIHRQLTLGSVRSSYNEICLLDLTRTKHETVAGKKNATKENITNRSTSERKKPLCTDQIPAPFSAVFITRNVRFSSHRGILTDTSLYSETFKEHISSHKRKTQTNLKWSTLHIHFFFLPQADKVENIKCQSEK